MSQREVELSNEPKAYHRIVTPLGFPLNLFHPALKVHADRFHSINKTAAEGKVRRDRESKQVRVRPLHATPLLTDWPREVVTLSCSHPYRTSCGILADTAWDGLSVGKLARARDDNRNFEVGTMPLSVAHFNPIAVGQAHDVAFPRCDEVVAAHACGKILERDPQYSTLTGSWPVATEASTA